MPSPPLLQQAIELYQAGQRGEARALLLKYVEIDPQDELAWLLLSNVVNDLDDRIVALENALVINPENNKAAKHLWRLKQKRNAAAHLPPESPAQRLEQAIKARDAGQGMLAFRIIRQLVREDDRNEQAWQLLVELSPDTDGEIVALKNLLHLNPAHRASKMRLTQLQRFRKDPLKLGELYEAWGEGEKAGYVYRQVAAQADSVIERREAERRMKNIELRKKAPGIRLVSPQVTLIRLTVGPVLLYSILAFIHGGLNPLHISPIFWLGGFSVVLGSFLMVVASVPETRIIWHRIWRKIGDSGPAPLVGLRTMGVLLWLLPNLLIVLDGFFRFWDTIIKSWG